MRLSSGIFEFKSATMLQSDMWLVYIAGAFAALFPELSSCSLLFCSAIRYFLFPSHILHGLCLVYLTFYSGCLSTVPWVSDNGRYSP